MSNNYDENNIFARILRGEIPCKKVFENDYALAFEDINPQTPVHVLIIPKGAYVSMDDFANNGSNSEIVGFIRALGATAAILGLPQNGYRILSNIGNDGLQEVPHLHVHMFGGARLGKMIRKS